MSKVMEKSNINTGNGSELMSRYLPPNSIEAEQSVLGAMLLEPKVADKAIGILTVNDFYRESHQELFRVLSGMISAGVTVDLITCQQELRKRNLLETIGGLPYLTGLFDAVPTAAHIEHYSHIVAGLADRRRLIDAARSISAMMYEPDPDMSHQDLIAAAQQTILGASVDKSNHEPRRYSDILGQVYEAAFEAEQNNGSSSHIKTGFSALDKLIIGFDQSDLYIIAARPAMGKTALVMQMALNMSRPHVQNGQMRPGRRGLLFSLEMRDIQLARRGISTAASVSNQAIVTGTLSSDEWSRLLDVVNGSDDIELYIEDVSSIKIAQIRSKCAAMIANGGLDYVMVDYLGLIGGDDAGGENRTREVDKIANGLKSIARDFNIPVVALCQLSRTVEMRGNKRPLLSDLRESGQIEANADAVIFIYRQAYYDMMSAKDVGVITDDEIDRQNQEPQDVELIVSKARSGCVGTAHVHFTPAFTRFSDIAYRQDGY
jgi:replicative DNA helicase